MADGACKEFPGIDLKRLAQFFSAYGGQQQSKSKDGTLTVYAIPAKKMTMAVKRVQHGLFNVKICTGCAC